MPFNADALRDMIRRNAIRRVVAGVRVGADLLVEHLKALVSGPGAEDVRGPAAVTPFLYVDQRGRATRRRGGGHQYLRLEAPGVQTGAGQDSICFEIREVNYDEGYILLVIGVDNSAPGGTYIQSYMLAHDLSIHYPTMGPAKGTGPILQRPWLRTGIHRYWNEFSAAVVLVGMGLA